MKLLTVVGARPQFVKSFPVSRALPDGHEEVLVHTGQHYDRELSAVFFEELGLSAPDYNLEVGSGSHAEQTAATMRRLDPVVATEDPDAMVVYGDTNSTVAAALVGARYPFRVAHVEAGLRSGNRAMPEEVNRVVTDHVADLLFAPSRAAERTLEREGLGDRTHRVGDVMYDALLWARDVARDSVSVLADLGLTEGEYVLATVHRVRNTDDPDRLERIVAALGALDDPVVFPAHPRTVQALEASGLRERAERSLRLVDPVGYLEFVRLLAAARAVATDSGGVQKEAFFLDTPCVTLREETEWVETVESGWNRLVGADPDAIGRALRSPGGREPKPAPYGDGDAAHRVLEVLLDD
ncbi:MAG: non-hydrolyzing UDP-N-acetylglucosamine 2-epimerase [Haloarculaceae archaeon]